MFTVPWRLDQEELDFFAGAQAVFDATRHDEELAGLENNVTVSELE